MKYKLISVLCLIGGVVSFVIAFYAFRQYQGFIATFDNYGIPKEIYTSRPEIAITIFKFKLGIFKYTVSGIIAWAICGFFLVKTIRKK